MVARAKVILKDLEQGKETPAPAALRARPEADETPDSYQMGLFSGVNDAVIEELKALDLNTLTPIEALTKLYELKGKTV